MSIRTSGMVNPLKTFAVDWSHFVRVRSFQVNSLSDIPDVLRNLKEEKFTGKVSFSVTQGTLASVTVEEKIKDLTALRSPE